MPAPGAAAEIGGSLQYPPRFVAVACPEGTYPATDYNFLPCTMLTDETGPAPTDQPLTMVSGCRPIGHA